MTTKGQMKPTCRVSLTASQAGENSQSNVPEHTIVSSILTDLIFRRNHRRRTALSGPPLNLRSSRTRAMRFKIQNRHNTIINFNINFQSWILRITIHKVHRSKNAVENFMNQTASNSKVESTLTRTKTLTNRSNHEPNNTIQLRNLYENQIMKKSRISVARAGNIFFDTYLTKWSADTFVACRVLQCLAGTWLSQPEPRAY